MFLSTRKIGCLLLLALMPVFAAAEGDVERGAVLADTCMGCHGIPGYRNAYPSYRVPKLGGQKEEYLYLALQGYKNKTRAHPTMRANAGSLQDQDMRDLAAFFASQEGKPETGRGTASLVEAGREKSATCVACHGAEGISGAPNWPNLAGQHQEYLIEAITQYQRGDRTDAVMAGQVQALTPEDVAAIAAFYASQPGLFTVAY